MCSTFHERCVFKPPFGFQVLTSTRCSCLPIASECAVAFGVVDQELKMGIELFGEVLLPGLLLMAYSACFLIASRTVYPEMVQPKVSWILHINHQSRK
ncbi:hypothetical protein STEG23_024998, partial [Scotinomys teguina]